MSDFVNTVDSIGDEALTSSIIDKSITEIHDNNATSIGSSAFMVCAELTTVNFQAATSIGSQAFQFCSKLTTVDFHAVTSISSQAFYNCPKVTTVILRSETMATLSNTNAFGSTPIESGTGYIYVPAALVDSYKAASNWSTYANQIRAIEDYPEVCDPYSWEAVAKHIELGDYATFYKVGDCVPLDLGSEGVVNMQIAAFDTDQLSDGSGTAAITWVAVELLNTTKRMNPKKESGTEGTGSIGGWDKCEVREYLQNTIKPLIPSNVSSMIKNVSKTQDAYDTSHALFSQTSNDELWIPGSKDGFVTTSGGILYTKNDRIKYLAKGSSATCWWMRDGCWTASSFCLVITNGAIDKYQTCYTPYGICLGFCT